MTNILAIGAHPDDVELGMGAAIAKLSRGGHRVSIIDLTDGEPTPCGSKEKRLSESLESSHILGVNERITLSFPNRYLEDTIEARKELASYIRRIKPEIIFCHFWLDKHPDHTSACRLTEAASFYSKLTKSDIPEEPWEVKRIYYFCAIHRHLNITPSFVLDVTDDFDKKIEAVKAYKSQFIENKNNSFILDYLKKQGQYWGSLIKRGYGESFISQETLGLNQIVDII